MSDDHKIKLFLEWYSKRPRIPLPDECTEESLEKRCWDIVKIEPYGRCLVATKNISEGDILFVDHPAVTGPKQMCGLMCLGCYRQVYEGEEARRCSKCKWTVCSEECEDEGYHPYECPILGAKGYTPNLEEFTEENPLYESILPLRAVLLKKHFPFNWSVYSAMECHEEQRKITDMWKLEQKNVCDFLRENTGVEDDDLAIHNAIGVLDVNCHEVRSNIPGSPHEYRVRGIYPLCAMMSHNCASNTHHTISENMTLLVCASRDIKKGEQITGSYTHILSGTIERRRHLRYGKFFDCSCDRCSDPTEFGTYFSAIKCTRHPCDGYLLPRIKEDSNAIADFMCEKCSQIVRGGIINKLTNLISMEIQSAPDNDPMYLERIFDRHKKSLHPNHFHLIGIKHSLSQMYGRVSGYMLANLNPIQMNRKIECCNDILKILSKIEPGMSRLKGLTLYEMHAPLLLRANRAFQNKAITKNDFLEVLRESLGHLKGAIYCLKYEPVSSFEGEICKIARGSASELSKWIETVVGLPQSRFLEEPKADDTVEKELTLESLLKKIEDYR